MNPKTLLQSKVFWLAIAQIVAAGIAIFATSYPDVGWLLVAKSLVDIYLRTQTTQPISGIVSTT